MAGSPKSGPGGEGLILNTLLNGIGVVVHTRYDDVTTVIVAGLRDQALLRARGARDLPVYCTRDLDTLILPQNQSSSPSWPRRRAARLCCLCFLLFKNDAERGEPRMNADERK